VRSAAPVRREIQEDGTALDHFTIGARVAGPAAPTPASTPSKSPKVGGGQ
jgi:hypothetical protein